MRNIAFLRFPVTEQMAEKYDMEQNDVIDTTNYTKLFKDPPDKHLQNPELVSFVQLEMTELGKYECFGEDYGNVSNFLLTPAELGKR